MKGVSIGRGRDKRTGGDVDMPEVMKETFSNDHVYVFNLHFLEEPSKKPTTNLRWTQLYGKAGIR